MNSFAKLLLIGAFGLAAQGAAAQSVCVYGGETYSAGAALRLGESLVSCKVTQDGATWIFIEEGSQKINANCRYASDEYSHGAVVTTSSGGIVCGNGRWYAQK